MELTKLQKNVLEMLKASPLSKRFYWTGGTLLAAKYFHHRLSFDLDFFTDAPFTYSDVAPFIQALQRKMRLPKMEEKKVFDRWEFFLKNAEEVRVEFVRYDFPALKPRKRWNGILIDSLDDLAANKTMALLDRHEPKDIIDMYFFLTKGGFTPAKLLALTKKKFGLLMDEGTLMGEAIRGCKWLKELTVMLFGSADEQKEMLSEIQKYFSDASAKYMWRQLGS